MLATSVVIEAARPEVREATDVIVLTEDVPAGTVLTASHVIATEMTGSLPHDVFFLSDAVVGRRTVIDLSAGTLVSDSLLVPTESQFALGGRHAIPVPLARPELADHYPPGTKVRVVIAPDTHGFDSGATRDEPVVIEDAIVVPSVRQEQQEVDGRGALGLPSGSGLSLGSGYLLLGVSPADAVLISSIGPTSPISVIIVE